jgi:hypothetical protein
LPPGCILLTQVYNKFNYFDIKMTDSTNYSRRFYRDDDDLASIASTAYSEDDGLGGDNDSGADRGANDDGYVGGGTDAKTDGCGGARGLDRSALLLELKRESRTTLTRKHAVRGELLKYEAEQLGKRKRNKKNLSGGIRSELVANYAEERELARCVRCVVAHPFPSALFRAVDCCLCLEALEVGDESQFVSPVLSFLAKRKVCSTCTFVSHKECWALWQQKSASAEATCPICKKILLDGHERYEKHWDRRTITSAFIEVLLSNGGSDHYALDHPYKWVGRFMRRHGLQEFKETINRLGCYKNEGELLGAIMKTWERVHRIVRCATDAHPGAELIWMNQDETFISLMVAATSRVGQRGPAVDIRRKTSIRSKAPGYKGATLGAIYSSSLEFLPRSCVLLNRTVTSLEQRTAVGENMGVSAPKFQLGVMSVGQHMHVFMDGNNNGNAHMDRACFRQVLTQILKEKKEYENSKGGTYTCVCVLLLDNASSHTNMPDNFLNQLERNGLYLAYFEPGLTSLLCQLDVFVFRALKHCARRMYEESAQRVVPGGVVVNNIMSCPTFRDGALRMLDGCMPCHVDFDVADYGVCQTLHIKTGAIYHFVYDPNGGVPMVITQVKYRGGRVVGGQSDHAAWRLWWSNIWQFMECKHEPFCSSGFGAKRVTYHTKLLHAITLGTEMVGE